MPVPDGRETRPASAHSIGRPALSSRVPRTRQTSFSRPPFQPSPSVCAFAGCMSAFCSLRTRSTHLAPGAAAIRPYATCGWEDVARCSGQAVAAWMETNRRSGRRLLPSAAAIVTCSQCHSTSHWQRQGPPPGTVSIRTSDIPSSQTALHAPDHAQTYAPTAVFLARRLRWPAHPGIASGTFSLPFRTRADKDGSLNRRSALRPGRGIGIWASPKLDRNRGDQPPSLRSSRASNASQDRASPDGARRAYTQGNDRLVRFDHS